MEEPPFWKRLWKWLLAWLANNALWELTRYFVVGTIAAGVASYGGARLMHEALATATNIFLVVFGLLLMGWALGLSPFPRRTKKIYYSIVEMQEKISILSVGSGPQLYVTPGKRLGIETIELIVVNLLPFSIELESIQVEIFLDGTNLTTRDWNVPLAIVGNSITRIPLRHVLTDNEAEIARNYRDQYLCCPLFKMGGTANFRTPQGLLLPIRVETQTRCFIYKEKI